ncbi:DUF2505 domain-containing protein [Pseudokineococcus marinus]|uniref:DUF2505 domain-containing protein n=1 Tax=Pseudokineococcus marinus TaxID=351215 RepID=A0A849BIP5_9ACTN|nr:DUF2505 domain-containing protein [Pseudokineococcus marinus]NNH23069.1 DUF2505 domain-containing protein [Pseudokineococcus marinus]
MRLSADVRYPASAAEVGRMLADPGFVDARDEATHPLSHSARVEGSPEGAFVVRSTRVMPTDDVPQVARRFVGDSLELHQTDSWTAPSADGGRTGTMTIEVVGAPVVLRADLRLEADGDGACTERMAGDLKASVPLVGGALEKAAEPAVRAAIRSEEAVGRRWLAERAG